MNGVDLQVIWVVMMWPLIACLSLPPLLTYLGLHVVKRGVIFVDLALAQVATLGTVVALILGYDFHDRIAFWISLGVTFLAAGLFSWSRGTDEGPVPQEAIIGITFVVAAAAVIVLLSRVAGGREELEHLRHFDTVRVKSSMPRMNYSCVVDAAIGTNLEGPPRGRTLDVITVMNNQHEGCCVISLDAPTGMSADDGSIPGAVVNAGVTMSVALPKIGIRPGGSVGRLYLGDIGIPPSLYGSLGLGSVQLPAFVSEVVG